MAGLMIDTRYTLHCFIVYSLHITDEGNLQQAWRIVNTVLRQASTLPVPTLTDVFVRCSGVLREKILPSLEDLAREVVGLQLELCRKHIHTAVAHYTL